MGRFWDDLRLLLYTQISQCFTPKPAAVPGNVIKRTNTRAISKNRERYGGKQKSRHAVKRDG
jgi:hypothetical protein